MGFKRTQCSLFSFYTILHCVVPMIVLYETCSASPWRDDSGIDYPGFLLQEEQFAPTKLHKDKEAFTGPEQEDDGTKPSNFPVANKIRLKPPMEIDALHEAINKHMGHLEGLSSEQDRDVNFWSI